MTKYYYHGSSRVAMRSGGEVSYLHGDHLGSTSLTTDDQGAVVHEARYLPFGQVRWSSGAGVTDFTFTGQRNESGFKLMDYNARYYSSRLGRFVSADIIVPEPENPQNFNRYAYTLNNPLNFVDPSGHCSENEENYYDCLALADLATNLIGSNTTIDGINVYDFHWTDEDQVRQFAKAHWLFKEIGLPLSQANMDTIDRLGPTPDQAIWLNDWINSLFDTESQSQQRIEWAGESISKIGKLASDPEWQEILSQIPKESGEAGWGGVETAAKISLQAGLLVEIAVAMSMRESLRFTIKEQFRLKKYIYESYQPRIDTLSFDDFITDYDLR